MMRGIEDELVHHKYSHVERERRFLVDPARRRVLDAVPFVLIEDRYIIGTRLRLRRMTDEAGGRVAMKLSKKYDVADVRARPMTTAYLTDQEHALFAVLPARPIVKRRYKVAARGGMFGIDVFAGDLAGLELAEIEQPDAAALAAIRAPEWTVREVSDDPRFQGGSLAGLDPAGLRSLLAA